MTDEVLPGSLFFLFAVTWIVPFIFCCLLFFYCKDMSVFVVEWNFSSFRQTVFYKENVLKIINLQHVMLADCMQLAFALVSHTSHWYFLVRDLYVHAELPSRLV